MTLDCFHYLPYILIFLIGVVVSKKPDGEVLDPIKKKYLEQHRFLPTFLTTPGNITINKGEEAILPCAIEHRGTRTVVWRMASNPSPITIGVKTYVSDTRFKVVHPRHSMEWNLRIMNAQPGDSGVYECQVSAVTRHIRQLMRLIVKDTAAVKRKQEITIKGSFFVEKGDTLKLQCNATGSEYHPDEIDWFKDGDKIKNSDRITLEKHVSLSDRTITSSLHIKRGHMNDAGTYVCRTSDLQVTSVKVNVLNTDTNNIKRVVAPGSLEDPEEDRVNHDSGASPLNPEPWVVLVTLLLLMLSRTHHFLL